MTKVLSGKPGRKVVEVSVQRETRPVGTLLHAARSLRHLARSDVAGSHWAGLGAVVVLAFAVEAFCQEHGPQVFGAEWQGPKPIERKPVKEKLRLLGRAANVKVNFGRPPWRDIAQLLLVRDSLAHAKPDEHSRALRLALADDEDEDALQRRRFDVEPWELLAEPNSAEAVARSVEQALGELLEGLGKGRWLLTMGSTDLVGFSISSG